MTLAFPAQKKRISTNVGRDTVLHYLHLHFTEENVFSLDEAKESILHD